MLNLGQITRQGRAALRQAFTPHNCSTATVRTQLGQQGKDPCLCLGTVLHREHADNNRCPSGR